MYHGTVVERGEPWLQGISEPNYEGYKKRDEDYEILTGCARKECTLSTLRGKHLSLLQVEAIATALKQHGVTWFDHTTPNYANTVSRNQRLCKLFTCDLEEHTATAWLTDHNRLRQLLFCNVWKLLPVVLLLPRLLYRFYLVLWHKVYTAASPARTGKSASTRASRASQIAKLVELRTAAVVDFATRVLCCIHEVTKRLQVLFTL